jgi:hypothetical protein
MADAAPAPEANPADHYIYVGESTLVHFVLYDNTRSDWDKSNATGIASQIFCEMWHRKILNPVTDHLLIYNKCAGNIVRPVMFKHSECKVILDMADESVKNAWAWRVSTPVSYKQFFEVPLDANEQFRGVCMHETVPTTRTFMTPEEAENHTVEGMVEVVATFDE